METKKGDLQRKILETFEDIALFPIDSIEVLLNAGHHASFGRLEHERNKIDRRRSDRRLKAGENKERNRRLQIYISKLKNQGLLTESKEKAGMLILSLEGQKKLMDLRSQDRYRNYKKEMIDHSLIVAFDIPESERGKRDWLRDILRGLGFEMIQRSVWVGQVRFPEELLADLEKLKILECVQVLEVTKQGTLKNIEKTKI